MPIRVMTLMLHSCTVSPIFIDVLYWNTRHHNNNLRQCQSEAYPLSSRNLSFADEWIWGGCGDNMQYGYKWAATSAPRLRFQKRIINNWLLICSELDFKLTQSLIFQICSKLHRHPRARGEGEGDWFSEIGKVSKTEAKRGQVTREKMLAL